MVEKYYCFVDETGQDTQGNLFLVAIVLKNQKDLIELEKKLEQIEKITGKQKLKWKKTNKKIKQLYVRELVKVKLLKNSVFYSIYKASKEYSKLTSLTIAKAVLAQLKQEYKLTVIIDGLNAKEREVVRNELKKLKIKYRKIRGMKDEQNIFLRLSDALAGFLREVYENKEYAQSYIKKLKKVNIIKEV